MIEIIGNIWKVKSDWICITTNGIVKQDGLAVMGKGLALQAVQYVEGVAETLGKLLKEGGNKVYEIGHYGYSDLYKNHKRVYSFPTKFRWQDNSDLNLIKDSCKQLKSLWEKEHEKPTVAMNRAGCGCGGLDWSIVKPVFKEYFPEDNFIVMSEKKWI